MNTDPYLVLWVPEKEYWAIVGPTYIPGEFSQEAVACIFADAINKVYRQAWGHGYMQAVADSANPINDISVAALHTVHAVRVN